MLVVVLTLAMAASSQPAVLSAVFDDATARQLMQLRHEFDEAELAAIREFDAAVGLVHKTLSIPVESYRTQRAPAGLKEDDWSEEQKRRAATAWPRRQRRVDDAEASLSTRTAAVLKRFGYTEDRLPSIRRRKWDGPAVYAFNFNFTVSAESRVLLQELRRLWTLSGRLTKNELR
jgi:hypothetical protein